MKDDTYNDPMITALEEDYVDSDEALIALAARTENASRALRRERLSHQTVIWRQARKKGGV